MTEDAFRPQRPDQDGSFEVKGNMDPRLQEKIQKRREQAQKEQEFLEQQQTEAQGEVQPEAVQPVQEPIPPTAPPPAQEVEVDAQEILQEKPRARRTISGPSLGSPQLQELINRIPQDKTNYDKVNLPSKGKFYKNEILKSGVLHIRPLLGGDEEVFATARYVKNNEAMDMIFEKVIKEPIDPTELLGIDRTYLLVYLRIISHSPSYEVEISCPDTDNKFSTEIDLNSLEVEHCPDDFGEKDLEGNLPGSKFYFRYRLPIGKDEQKILSHKNKRINMFGDSAVDDTMTYKTAILLEEIEGITSENDLKILLKKLPAEDVNYLRNVMNDPPFGVDTQVKFISPFSANEFFQELPVEMGFFFPRLKKREQT
jgi:hypothetical protein